MDLGLHYWNFSTPGGPQRIADTLAAAAKTAEKAGFAEFSSDGSLRPVRPYCVRRWVRFPPDYRC
jgi:hypothetical protein